MDEIIKPIAQMQPSYVEDTPDFLRKLNKIQEENQEDLKKAKEVYLVSLDVDALYTNIENNEGLEALQEKVEQNRHARPLGWAVAKLMELVLLLNNFVSNGINFLQIKGTSMGARCSPNYSNIYMAKWEEKFVYKTAFWRYIRCWLRYIDDIFMIWVGSKQKLNEFLKYLNSVHQSIKFKYKVSSKKVDFLDTTVIRNKDGRLITDVYQKPTDTHSYLNSNSELRGILKGTYNDHWNILQTKSKLRRTHKERPLVAYRRPKSLRDSLVKAEFQWEKGQDVTLGSRRAVNVHGADLCKIPKNLKAFQT